MVQYGGPPPGWYDDPVDPWLVRYWNGELWTADTRPNSGSLPTPLPAAAPTNAGGLPWWQTWFAIVPGLVLCFPLGLVGVWKRPSVSLRTRLGITGAVVALLVVGSLLPSDDDSTGKQPAADSRPSTTTTTSAATTAPSEADESTPSVSSTGLAVAAPPAATSAPPRPKHSVVPTVTGLTVREATQLLRAQGLDIREVRSVPSAAPVGTILHQLVRAGAAVPRGSEIVIVVAAPYPMVPNVVGSTESAARSRLEEAGFQVKETIETRASGRDGVVLSEDPAGSELAAPGSTVAIVILSVVQAVAPTHQDSCTPGYSPCLPPLSDYDCATGSGDGPGYAHGPIRVTGDDPYDLDRDGDGLACEDG